MTKQYICTREWARSAKGDIVDSYEYGRFPKEIQNKCFELHKPKTKIKVPASSTAHSVDVPTVDLKTPSVQSPSKTKSDK